MRVLSVALTASLIMAGLIGCASSHTKPKYDEAHHRHSYAGEAHRHGHSHGRAHGHSSEHGHHHRERRTYHRPAPVPGRTPDGRYVLPGGLESVCAGGTPPPCQ